MADVTKEYVDGQRNSPSMPGGYGDGRDCLKFAGERFKDYTANTPPDAAVLSPWVVVKLKGVDGFEIKVGNNSSSMRHSEASQSGDTGAHPHAAVTSLEYGLSNGGEGKIEIVDEMGGSFTTFFQRGLVKSIDNVGESTVVEVNFGWIGVKCNGELLRYPEVDDWTVYLNLLDIDVNISEGKIKYVLNCVDIMNISVVAPQTADSPAMSLKKAIITLLEDKDPKMDVAFLRKAQDGGPPQEWKFPAAHNKKADENGNGGSDGEGPVNVWKTENDTKLAIIQKWLADFPTENGNGVTPTCDPCRGKPVLLLWEGSEDTTKDNTLVPPVSDARNPTFIVNGGKCSNVISFAPNMNFVAAFFMQQNSGSGGSVVSNETIKGPSGAPGSTIANAKDKTEIGQQVAIPLTNAAVDAYGGDASKKTTEANVAQSKANAPFEVANPIEAELKIIGNPSRQFVDIRRFFNTTVTIIFINPFTIDKNTQSPSLDDNLCGDWLAVPAINPILTNNRWWVQGINHSLRDGKYTTTMKLFLQGPGIQLAAGTPLGGDPNAPVIDGAQT
jgi:hypothetical protein